MSGRSARRGFTVVELLATAVAASILAIALGSVLYFVYAALRRSNEALNLQRDMSYALELLQRTGRSASPSEVTLGSGSVTFGTNMFRPKGCRFYDNRTGDFVYDPDLSRSGDDQTLINDRLVAFDVALDGSRLLVRLSVQTAASQTLSISNSITMRN
ncbi:MAG: hypothetical protein N2652_08910 [Kiritimatiellae bacterium]|nr:hypothetical protein [Kiritimatiellia bacterium]